MPTDGFSDGVDGGIYQCQELVSKYFLLHSPTEATEMQGISTFVEASTNWLGIATDGHWRYPFGLLVASADLATLITRIL